MSFNDIMFCWRRPSFLVHDVHVFLVYTAYSLQVISPNYVRIQAVSHLSCWTPYQFMIVSSNQSRHCHMLPPDYGLITRDWGMTPTRGQAVGVNYKLSDSNAGQRIESSPQDLTKWINLGHELQIIRIWSSINVFQNDQLYSSLCNSYILVMLIYQLLPLSSPVDKPCPSHLSRGMTGPLRLRTICWELPDVWSFWSS